MRPTYQVNLSKTQLNAVRHSNIRIAKVNLVTGTQDSSTWRMQARAAALSADDDGRASSAFVLTVERMKNDSSLKDLSGEQAFSNSAAWADAPSHNALLAFAYATSRVREYTPDAVRRVLGTLRLDAKDSTVAYPLDFSSSYAAGGQVGLLYPDRGSFDDSGCAFLSGCGESARVDASHVHLRISRLAFPHKT